MRIRIIRNTRINTRTCVLQYAYGGLKYGRRVQLARRRANVASTQYFFMNFIGNRLFRLYMTRRRTTWTRRRVISASHRPKICRTLADFHGGGNANPANPRVCEPRPWESTRNRSVNNLCSSPALFDVILATDCRELAIRGADVGLSIFRCSDRRLSEAESGNAHTNSG